MNGKKRSMMLASAALVGLAAAASAQSHASPLSIVTNEDPAEPGAFTLDFGDLGVAARGNITSTNYELNIDTVQGTAHFVSYLQHVEPLTLPGGFSTGDITVQIVDGSSSGSFDGPEGRGLIPPWTAGLWGRPRGRPNPCCST